MLNPISLNTHSSAAQVLRSQAKQNRYSTYVHMGSLIKKQNSQKYTQNRQPSHKRTSSRSSRQASLSRIRAKYGRPPATPPRPQIQVRVTFPEHMQQLQQGQEGSFIDALYNGINAGSEGKTGVCALRRKYNSQCRLGPYRKYQYLPLPEGDPQASAQAVQGRVTERVRRGRYQHYDQWRASRSRESSDRSALRLRPKGRPTMGLADPYPTATISRHNYNINPEYDTAQPIQTVVQTVYVEGGSDRLARINDKLEEYIRCNMAARAHY